MLTVPADQKGVVADYLAKNFPEKPKPPAVIIPGDVSVSIKEWVVPSLGSRPHDPLATPDGAIWWTGQWANVLGRLDPKTGVMKEFPLKTDKSGPHGLAADKDGNIWYTGNSAALVGKLDPKTQMPSFLQMVLLLHEYRDDVTLPGVAGVATRGLGLVLAPLARARGYRGRYPQYSDPDSP